MYSTLWSLECISVFTWQCWLLVCLFQSHQELLQNHKDIRPVEICEPQTPSLHLQVNMKSGAFLKHVLSCVVCNCYGAHGEQTDVIMIHYSFFIALGRDMRLNFLQSLKQVSPITRCNIYFTLQPYEFTRHSHKCQVNSHIKADISCSRSPIVKVRGWRQTVIVTWSNSKIAAVLRVLLEFWWFNVQTWFQRKLGRCVKYMIFKSSEGFNDHFHSRLLSVVVHCLINKTETHW